jgi:hypothetical protein
LTEIKVLAPVDAPCFMATSACEDLPVPPMPTLPAISIFLGQDHTRCDALFVEAERLVGAGDFVQAQTAYEDFFQAMARHFAMEEEVLFPGFEAAIGSSTGPTAMMRHEHEQMRALFREMAEALSAHQGDHFLGTAETLLILMQQHNAKEEQILYPMTDRTLEGREVVSRMRELAP